MFNNSCQWLDLNPGPLVLEATALPTAPQPLPKNVIVNLFNSVGTAIGGRTWIKLAYLKYWFTSNTWFPIANIGLVQYFGLQINQSLNNV